MSANELTVPSWRRGLRKTTSTSMVHEQMNENEDKSIPRSASSPRLALDNRIEIVSGCPCPEIGEAHVLGGCAILFLC